MTPQERKALRYLYTKLREKERRRRKRELFWYLLPIGFTITMTIAALIYIN